MKSFPLCVLSLSLLLLQISAQQISDVWLITWDRKSLFTSIGTGKFPVNFTDPGSAGDADIVADDGTVYQSILGFGRSLTDSSAITLSNLQSANSDRYWTLLKTLFDTTDGANAAGLDDTPGDTSFNRFSVDRTPSQVPAVLKDILSINPQIKIHILPWSPPAWMKDSVTMDGGSLEANLTTAYSAYLLNAVKSYFKEGFTVYAVSIQNEPENNDKTYPSATMTAVVQARIGKSLRTLLDQNNFNNVKIIGNEHNWSDAAGFPISLIQSAPDAFDGVAFHCYQGAVADQDEFSSKFPSKEIYMTECSGTIGSDWWGDIKWYMDNLWIGALEHGAMAALMWNLALDDKGQPMLPESDSCDGGCRGIVTVSGGDYTLDQEFYSMAQASKAILPVNAGGPFGRRIDVAVKGASNSALRVGAYATGGVKGTDRTRYALVVMNWNDNSSQGSFNPTPVKATIEFRGKQAKYTFPVGVTTLWWFAPSN
ncbi:glycoside hydrolase family 30 protein [Collybiopsis luxurians FD-317 M1]|uniref:Glycoside hydrolase family 30 protein n=1 Tax=Collybiopsis luxurians FD-317 M1 TaxID=944289 RepID=A0A0D0CMA0_9AGAR|nr:glycoside hydrolase family 30 protein [Collybiopsis luxurians FD-317 M1]